MSLLKVFRKEEGWVDAEPDDLFIPTVPHVTVLGPTFICLLCGAIVLQAHLERHLNFHREAPYPMYIDIRDAINAKT